MLYIYTKSVAITNGRMARAMRGTTRLLVVGVHGTGCGGGGSCAGVGRYVFLYLCLRYTPKTMLSPTAVWPARGGAVYGTRGVGGGGSCVGLGRHARRN